MAFATRHFSRAIFSHVPSLIHLGFFLLLFTATTAAQDAPQVELDTVTVRRNDRGHLEALLVLKQPLPDSMKKVTVRLVFVQDGSGLTPKAVSDIPAPPWT